VSPTAVSIDVHLSESTLDQLRHDVAEGLTSTPKSLPPKWFYDEVGSDLFDRITRLADYYPTEAERSGLRLHAAEIVAASGADTLVELGSGSSDKSRVLLDAMAKGDTLDRYIPFDVSETALRDATDMIAERYQSISVHGVVGDFDHHLGLVPREGTRMVAFLGGTVGNYEPVSRAELLGTIADNLRPGESLLLGTDLVKDTGRLVRAYDDSEGVTALFNLNVLRVVNANLGADFDLDRFRHRAVWNETDEWIEMQLVSVGDQTVHISDLDLTIEMADGEHLLTEISAKFRRSRVEAELTAVGLEPIGWYTDPAGDFALSLSRR
jgi:L-histidine N-alpha-methyltransferase